MKKLIGTIIVATTIGAPTFAQSFEADNRSTVAATTARAHSKPISRHRGQQTYAMSRGQPLDNRGTSKYPWGPGYNFPYPDRPYGDPDHW
jgi:hypothetical protein